MWKNEAPPVGWCAWWDGTTVGVSRLDQDGMFRPSASRFVTEAAAHNGILFHRWQPGEPLPEPPKRKAAPLEVVSEPDAEGWWAGMVSGGAILRRWSVDGGGPRDSDGDGLFIYRGPFIRLPPDVEAALDALVGGGK